MKKIFTVLSLAALAAAGANAADFITVTVDGTEVKNGDVVISNKLHVDEFEGEILNWELKPDFKLSSKEFASYTLDLTNAGETTFQFCGIHLDSPTAMPGNCYAVEAGKTLNYKGDFDADENYVAEYDYKLTYGDPVPEKVECKGHFKMVAEGETGDQTLEFDVNMVYPGGEGAVDGIADEKFTLVVGNGRVAAADGKPVEVWTLSGARVANEGLNGVYVVRVGGKALKVAVK